MPKSVLDRHGRTKEFNMLQQMLTNFNAAHARAVEAKDENLRNLFNDSIENVDHLLHVEQKRIEQMSGSKPSIMQQRIESGEHILDEEFNNELGQSHHDPEY